MFKYLNVYAKCIGIEVTTIYERIGVLIPYKANNINMYKIDDSVCQAIVYNKLPDIWLFDYPAHNFMVKQKIYDNNTTVLGQIRYNNIIQNDTMNVLCMIINFISHKGY